MADVPEKQVVLYCSPRSARFAYAGRRPNKRGLMPMKEEPLDSHQPLCDTLVMKWSAGSAAIRSAFEASGYVLIEELLDVDDLLVPVAEEYGRLANQIADQLHQDGRSFPYDASESVDERLLQIIRHSDGAAFQQFDISLPLDEQISANTPMHHGPAVFNLLTNDALLDAVELIIGPEIYSNPVQHVRIKPPERYLSDHTRSHTLIGKTFWHQDLAVITDEADQSNVLSVWLPMVDVFERNGCLVVVPGSHTDGLVKHCRTNNLDGIPQDRIGGEPMALPMSPGDVLLFHKLTRHASLPNRSHGLRWSFDLRYNPVGEATGRSWFPGFVARSDRNRQQVLNDWRVWANQWHTARNNLTGQAPPQFNRWDPADPLCA